MNAPSAKNLAKNEVLGDDKQNMEKNYELDIVPGDDAEHEYAGYRAND